MFTLLFDHADDQVDERVWEIRTMSLPFVAQYMSYPEWFGDSVDESRKSEGSLVVRCVMIFIIWYFIIRYSNCICEEPGRRQGIYDGTLNVFLVECCHCYCYCF